MVLQLLPSLKRTNRHGKSTVLMVFTRKDADFHGRAVSFREGSGKGLAWDPWLPTHANKSPSGDNCMHPPKGENQINTTWKT